MHLERACSGTRQDLATNGSLPILKNLTFYVEFVLDQKRHNIKAVNGFVKALDRLVPSVEMRSYVRVMTIYDVAVVRPHRFLTGKAHELHLDVDGNDCKNGWVGTASMPSVTDAIYSAMVAIVLDPKDFWCGSL